MILVVTSEVVMRGESIEDLAAVGEVGLEGENIVVGAGEVDEVDIEDLVALFEELWDAMASSLA